MTTILFNLTNEAWTDMSLSGIATTFQTESQEAIKFYYGPTAPATPSEELAAGVFKETLEIPESWTQNLYMQSVLPKGVVRKFSKT